MELASACGVGEAKIAALEQGLPGISTTELGDVALALELDPAALLSGREVARPVPSVFLRHAPYQDFDDRDSSVLDGALEQARALEALEVKLALPPTALRAGVFEQRDAGHDRDGAAAQDGYQLARAVRAWLGEPTTRLDDVCALLEQRFGVAVLVRELRSARVTAVSVRAASAAAVVLSSIDPIRAGNPLVARVHLVHELCHVLFDPSAGGLHIVVDRETDAKANAAEQRARAFAAELLLPLDGLTELLGPPTQITDPSRAEAAVAKARSRFGTPWEIAANHLCNRRFVHLDRRERLIAGTLPFEGLPPSTGLPSPGAASLCLTARVEAAHREGLATDGEARALLGIDRLAPLPWDGLEA